jgi:hypothetical protein
MFAPIRSRAGWAILLALVGAEVGDRLGGALPAVGCGLMAGVLVWLIYPFAWGSDSAPADSLGPKLPDDATHSDGKDL